MAARNRIFYPDSQIKKNCYTLGNEWMLEDYTPYTGDYHYYIDGLVMTGADYDPNTSERLIPYDENKINNIASNYDDINPNKISTYITPTQYYPIPSLSDYNNGYINRYFIRKNNSRIEFNDLYEIKYITFKQWQNKKINNTLYTALTLEWKLTGPLHDTITNSGITNYGVYDTNKRIVIASSKTFIGLNYYLTNYTELSIWSKGTDVSIRNKFKYLLQ